MKFDVQVNDEQRSNNPQNGFIGRNEEDFEKLLDNMIMVGEERGEDIQWDRVVNDIEEIYSSQETNIRGVDQILRQDSRHDDHNENPIRMWANPDANEIEATIYKPGQETILSNLEAVEGFNQIFNDQSAPSQTLQIAAEEHYLNQNSEAIEGFEDISNIKWAILEDEGAHGEQAPRNRGEHLTTNTNTQYDIQGFYVEKDGEPLEPEQINSLKNEIIRRDQFTVPKSEPNKIPEIMLEYNSLEEAVSDRNIEKEEFDSEYKRAQKTGLVNEEGNVTLKGWLSAVDMQASDVRTLEEVAEGDERIDFDEELAESLDLDAVNATGVARFEITNNSALNARFESESEDEVAIEDGSGSYTSEQEEFLTKYSVLGFDPKKDPLEDRQFEHKLKFSEYLSKAEGIDIDWGKDDKFGVVRSENNSEAFEELVEYASRKSTNPDMGEYSEELVDIFAYIEDFEVDHDVELHTNFESEEVSERILEEFREIIGNSIEFDSGDKVKGSCILGEFAGNDGGWSDPDIGIYESGIFEVENHEREFDVMRAFKSDDESEIEIDTVALEPLDIMKLRNPHLDKVQSNYSEEEALGKYDIPRPDENEGIRNTAQDLEELGLMETRMVEDNPAEIKVDADNPVEYRQVMDVLSEIEGLEFDKKHQVEQTRKTATDLDYVTARISIKDEYEDGLPEEFEDDLNEFFTELKEEGLIRKDRKKVHTAPEDQKFYSEEENFVEAFILNSEETIEAFSQFLTSSTTSLAYPEGIIEAYSPRAEATEEEIESEFEELSFFEDIIYDSERIEVPDTSTLEGTVYWDNDMEEETLDFLGELYSDDIIEVEVETLSPYNNHNSDWEVPPPDDAEIGLPGDAKIEKYHELDEETISRLQELDEKGLIELSDSDYRLEVEREYSSSKYIRPKIEGEVTATELEIEDGVIEIEGEYETTDDTIYEVNQELRRIAENLDPLNFEKDSYEEIEVETNFRYDDCRQPAA